MLDGITDYGAFVAAFIVFQFIPGPGNLVVITSTAQGGVRGGLAATLGLVLGDQVYIWLSLLGVAALVKANPDVFGLVQYAGAAYLAWLGVKLLRAQPGDAPVLRIPARQYFRQGMLITLLNPKAIVFYLAFLPVFLKPGVVPTAATFATLALTCGAITLLYCGGVVAVVRRTARALQASPRLVSILNKLAGSLLVAFGIKLASGR